MVDNDGLPSNAFVQTPNGPPSKGTWRRHEEPRTYCHEVLHLSGLKDQYCSRLFDSVHNSSIVEVSCVPPPDPSAGNCCVPTAAWPRCGQTCTGHTQDIMATLSVEVSCSNILDVVKKAGLDNCPEKCCVKPRRAILPKNLIFLGPSYMHFGDKDIHYGSFGVTGEYTHMVGPRTGLTFDVGFYTHTDNQQTYTEKYTQLNLTGGITYYPFLTQSQEKSPLLLSTHALLGISSYTSKYSITGYGTTSGNQISLNPNIGAAIDFPLNPNFNIRLLQLDYTPTFFAKTIQNNYRISLGAVLKLP
jgi:hypothetical protein